MVTCGLFLGSTGCSPLWFLLRLLVIALKGKNLDHSGALGGLVVESTLQISAFFADVFSLIFKTHEMERRNEEESRLRV